MQLVMYIGNDFIASTTVIRQKITEPGYLSGLKRQLMKEYGYLLQHSTLEPDFLVVTLSSTLPPSLNQNVSTR